MFKKIIIFAGLLLVIIFVGVIISRRGQGPVAGFGKGALKGVSLSPKSFEPTDFTDFFQKSSQAGGAVSWAGDWNELSDAKGAPAVVASLASSYKYVPVIEAQFFTQSSGRLLRPLNAATEKNYKDAAADFAFKYQPKYFGLGVEVNILYEKSPAEFESFVKFFDEVYAAIKAKSPNTKIFTIFQLEKMKGLNGGLFGGVNNPAKSQWALLEKFPKADLIAFTTYPGLIYKNPADIPIDYYSEIKKHTNKPMAFTEIGWSSSAAIKGWENSEAKQTEFVKTFFALTKDLKPELSIWSFLYDPDTFEPFKSMGLFNTGGSAKTAWLEWLKY